MTTATTGRTDPHRPSVMDPADYTWIGSYPPTSADVGADWLFRCEHCGHWPCLWGEEYHHAPTGDDVLVGHICATHYFDMDDRAQAESARTRRTFMAARERDKNRRTAAELNPEAASELEELAMELAAEGRLARWEGFDFMMDMVRRWRGSRPFTERQLGAVVRCVERDRERQERIARLRAEREARLVAAPTLEAGRRDIEGIVVSTKSGESEYGWWYKMLVELDDGCRVYGSVPGPLQSWECSASDDGTVRQIRGQRVAFSAELEGPRPDDPHFSFFKRPTKSRII